MFSGTEVGRAWDTRGETMVLAYRAYNLLLEGLLMWWAEAQR